MNDAGEPQGDGSSAQQLECPSCGDAFTVGLVPRGGTSVDGGENDTVVSTFEVDVLRMVADGMTDVAIASALDVPVHRVKRSVREWMIRLGAQNRTSAAVRGRDLGLLG